MSRRKRIGIMGGTFDPVHMVHLTLAENAYHSFGLDEVLMLPNGDPPHKNGQNHYTGSPQTGYASAGGGRYSLFSDF